MVKTGDYTIVRGLLGAVNSSDVAKDNPITITFLDDKGNRLGSATTTLAADRPQGIQSFAVFLGKGDFTNAKSVTIELGK